MTAVEKGRQKVSGPESCEARKAMSEKGTGSILHAVVYYPHLNFGRLNEFRRKYDPYAELIAEHLTLVFPIPVEFEMIHGHVRTVVREVRPFDIHISGLKRTWDHWMYLGLEEGYEEVRALHDRLYSGPLEKYLRTDLEFEPHVALGFFGKGSYDPLDPAAVEFESEAYGQALREAEDLRVDARRRVGTLTVARLNAGLDTLEDLAVVEIGS